MTQIDDTAKLTAMKEALLECINEAETADELQTYKDMLAKFTIKHPEI